MRLHSDFLSRLKDIARRKSRGFGNDTSRIVAQWSMILLFSIFAVTLAAGYAVYRFSYWSSIEERVAKEEVGTTEYDEKAIERILNEFEDKEDVAKDLMGIPLPESTVPPTVEVQSVGSGDASPALGE